MRAARTVGAVVAVALAAGALVACSTSFTDGARPGEAQPGGGGALDSPAHKAVVQLPLGPLTVEVGKPAREIDTIDGSKRAADGARWVAIAWSLGGNGADYENNLPTFQFQVTLIADGRRYALQAGQAGESDQAASRYRPVVKEKSLDVVVQGAGKHLAAEVEYDGGTQQVDFDTGKIIPGLAAPLYRKNAQTPVLAQTHCALMSATDALRFRGVSGNECTLGAVQTAPYVGGLGWVTSADETWTLVPLNLHLIYFGANNGQARYSNFDLEQLSVTVDGKKPTTEILRYRDQRSLDFLRGGTLVFRTSSTPRSVQVSITVRGQNEEQPSQFHVFRGQRTYQLN